MAVIDVFRAFTTAAVALANGASTIAMVRTVEEVLALREAGIGQICMGEVRGRAWRHQPPVSPLCGEAPDGFDFRNSPFEVSGVDSEAGRSSSGPVQAHKALSRRQTKPSDFTLPHWSRQRRLSASFSRIPLIRSPWSPWATTG